MGIIALRAMKVSLSVLVIVLSDDEADLPLSFSYVGLSGDAMTSSLRSIVAISVSSLETVQGWWSRNRVKGGNPLNGWSEGNAAVQISLDFANLPPTLITPLLPPAGINSPFLSLPI